MPVFTMKVGNQIRIQYFLVKFLSKSLVLEYVLATYVSYGILYHI